MSTETKSKVSGTPAVRDEPSRHPIVGLRQEIDRLFDDFFTGGFAPFSRFGFGERPLASLEPIFGRTLPQVDVSETDKEFRISAELPGMEEKDIDVTMSEGMITIRGEKKEERKEDKENYHLMERSYGSICRSFRVPEEAELDKADASFENGLLKVTVPKTLKPKSKEKKIKVRVK